MQCNTLWTIRKQALSCFIPIPLPLSLTVVWAKYLSVPSIACVHECVCLYVRLCVSVCIFVCAFPIKTFWNSPGCAATKQESLLSDSTRKSKPLYLSIYLSGYNSCSSCSEHILQSLASAEHNLDQVQRPDLGKKMLRVRSRQVRQCSKFNTGL